MSESFTEISHESHPRRVSRSILFSILAAIFLIFLFYLFISKEHEWEMNRQGLIEAGAKVHTIKTDLINEKNNGKVIHLTGKISSNETVRDPVFKFQFNTLKVERIVEMYQWEETTKIREHVKTGGSSIRAKTYTYSKVWGEELIDSDKFRKGKYKNPKSFKLKNAVRTVNDAKTGKFLISKSHIKNIETYKYKIKDLSNVPKGMYTGRLHLTKDGYLYIGDNPEKPKIGDHRISYFVADKTIYSLIGEQNKSSVNAFKAQSGAEIAVIKKGKYKAGELIKIEKEELNMTKWITRFVIFIFYIFMIYVILNPIAVLADIIPKLGFYKRSTNLGTALTLAISLSIFSIYTGKYNYNEFMNKCSELGVKIMEKTID